MVDATRHISVEEWLSSDDADLKALQADIGEGYQMLMARSQRDSGINTILGRAKAEYIDAIRGLINANLQTQEGIALALQLQSEAKRFRDLIAWVNDTFTAHNKAVDELDQAEDPLPEGSPYEPGEPHSGTIETVG